MIIKDVIRGAYTERFNRWIVGLLLDDESQCPVIIPLDTSVEVQDTSNMSDVEIRSHGYRINKETIAKATPYYDDAYNRICEHDLVTRRGYSKVYRVKYNNEEDEWYLVDNDLGIYFEPINSFVDSECMCGLTICGHNVKAYKNHVYSDKPVQLNFTEKQLHNILKKIYWWRS